jgi:hypothetical protein
MITQHLHAIQLRPGQGLLVSNSRWLHGRDRYTSPARVTLPILDDPSSALVSSRTNARHTVGTSSMTMPLSPHHAADRPGPD